VPVDRLRWSPISGHARSEFDTKAGAICLQLMAVVTWTQRQQHRHQTVLGPLGFSKTVGVAQTGRGRGRQRSADPGGRSLNTNRTVPHSQWTPRCAARGSSAGGRDRARWLVHRQHAACGHPGRSLSASHRAGRERSLPIHPQPAYLGFALAYAGISLLAGGRWPLVFLPGVLGGIDRGVIAREEAYLQERFGAPYRHYRSRVRRWL